MQQMCADTETHFLTYKHVHSKAVVSGPYASLTYFQENPDMMLCNCFVTFKSALSKVLTVSCSLKDVTFYSVLIRPCWNPIALLMFVR